MYRYEVNTCVLRENTTRDNLCWIQRSTRGIDLTLLFWNRYLQTGNRIRFVARFSFHEVNVFKQCTPGKVQKYRLVKWKMVSKWHCVCYGTIDSQIVGPRKRNNCTPDHLGIIRAANSIDSTSSLHLTLITFHNVDKIKWIRCDSQRHIKLWFFFCHDITP